MLDWMIDHGGHIAAATLIGCGVLVGVSLYSDHRLMTECMKDHKEYECVAMLKQDVVPVFIPIGR